VADASSAPNAPWTTRPVSSMPKFCAAPPNAEATANPITPLMKTRLRPKRSAMRPPSNSRLPNASGYPVTIHCRRKTGHVT
jgi:hypothetical protein